MVAAAVGATILVGRWVDPAWEVAAIVLAVMLPVTLVVVRGPLAPVLAMFRALAGTVTSYKDGDFAFSLAWEPNDARLGVLSRRAQRARRHAARQREALRAARELLLDTMVQNTLVAMLLVDPSGRVVYGNPRAQAGREGRRLEGVLLADILRARAGAAARGGRAGGDGLFIVERDGEEDVYYLARSGFLAERARASSCSCCARSAVSLHRAAGAQVVSCDPRDQPRANNSLAPIASARAPGRRARRARHVRPAREGNARRSRSARSTSRGLIQGYAKFAKPAHRRAGADRVA